MMANVGEQIRGIGSELQVVGAAATANAQTPGTQGSKYYIMCRLHVFALEG